MFYQVRVKFEDCDVLCFFWWEDSDFIKGVVDYQMLVYLFGVLLFFCCVSFVFKKIVNDNKFSFDVFIIDIVNCNFYVDDCFKLVFMVLEVYRFVFQLLNFFVQGGFYFIKWISNCCEVLKFILVYERVFLIRDLDFEDLFLDCVLGI